MKRIRAEVLSSRNVGNLHSIALVAPEIAERAQPGQFIQVAMPPGQAMVLRRPFAIHRASKQGGWAGTIEFSFDRRGPGTEWLADARAHQLLDVIGPLGKGFAVPKDRENCLLVAEGYAAGQLYFLAEELRAREKRVDMIVGGLSHEDVFKPIEAKRLSRSVSFVTADGSLGERGRAGDMLADVASTCGSDVVYAGGPRSLLRVVADFCRDERIPSQVAVEERMACGWGQCYSCVVPVAAEEGGAPEMVRSCVEGPVFNSQRVLWDLWMGSEDG
jgi:dihydroorotate dehydrogenase electron transfer subunit